MLRHYNTPTNPLTLAGLLILPVLPPAITTWLAPPPTTPCTVRPLKWYIGSSSRVHVVVRKSNMQYCHNCMHTETRVLWTVVQQHRNKLITLILFHFCVFWHSCARLRSWSDWWRRFWVRATKAFLRPRTSVSEAPNTCMNTHTHTHTHTNTHVLKYLHSYMYNSQSHPSVPVLAWAVHYIQELACLASDMLHTWEIGPRTPVRQEKRAIEEEEEEEENEWWDNIPLLYV